MVVNNLEVAQNSIKMIEIENLSYRYGKDHTVLDGLSFNVPKGSIFGFIGSNGAGKSTSIRCILGLLKPTMGLVKVFGIERPDKNISIRGRIGYLIESPQFYGNLTCYENLLLLKEYLKFENTKIKEVLILFGLWEYKDNLYSTFSTGMKQRLGIAKSFLTNPELLILDEPLNGLDPQWIFEVRNILQSINTKFGTTIFLSSHILSELEKIATHIGILKNGKIVFQGKIDELLNKRNAKTITFMIEATDFNFNIDHFPGIKLNTYIGNALEFDMLNGANLNELFHYLLSNGIKIIDVTTKSSGLEEIVTKIYSI